MGYIIFLIGLIAIDQLTKFMVLTNLKEIGTYPIIQDVLHFTYAENSGTAFSMFADKKLLVMGITSVVLVAVLYYLVSIIKAKSESKLYIISLTMILSGGLGNLIDRFRIGYVVDFIDFRVINFAIFNVADIFIVVGVCLVIVDLLTHKKSQGKNGF